MSDVVSIAFLFLMAGTFVLGVIVGKCLAYDEIFTQKEKEM